MRKQHCEEDRKFWSEDGSFLNIYQFYKRGVQMTDDLPIEDLLPRSNYSMYALVSMAAARALELSDGKRCLVENPSSEKLTTQALQEIAQGKI